MEKKLDGNYTRMLQALLNNSRRQHPIKQQLYGPQQPMMKTIKIRWTRRVGPYWRNRDELRSDVLLWTPSAKANDQLGPTYSSSVLIWDVALRTCQKQWAIGRGGERGSGITVLIAQHDDDDDLQIFIMMEKSEFHVLIKHCFLMWKNTAQANQWLDKCYSDSAL